MKFLFNFEIGNCIAKRCARSASQACTMHTRRLNMIVIKMKTLVLCAVCECVRAGNIPQAIHCTRYTYTVVRRSQSPYISL